MNRLPQEKIERLVALLVEGNSIRGISRILDMTKRTVLRNLVWIGEACQKFHDENVRGLKCKEIQADETWNFIYAKEKNVPKLKKAPPEAGSCWTWVAIDPISNLVPSWYVGKQHDSSEADFLMGDLASRIPGKVQITTDQLMHYRPAIETAFGDRVNYATIQKKLADVTKTPDQKFEPQEFKGQRQASIYGNPDPERVTTTSVESNNLRMRLSMRRYMRSMNGFSRSLKNQRAAVALHFMHHNFCRISPPIKVTPAMEAGIADHVWDIEELTALVPAIVPNRPKTYKKRVA